MVDKPALIKASIQLWGPSMYARLVTAARETGIDGVAWHQVFRPQGFCIIARRNCATCMINEVCADRTYLLTFHNKLLRYVYRYYSRRDEAKFHTYRRQFVRYMAQKYKEVLISTKKPSRKLLFDY